MHDRVATSAPGFAARSDFAFRDHVCRARSSIPGIIQRSSFLFYQVRALRHALSQPCNGYICKACEQAVLPHCERNFQICLCLPSIAVVTALRRQCVAIPHAALPAQSTTSRSMSLIPHRIEIPQRVSGCVFENFPLSRTALTLLRGYTKNVRFLLPCGKEPGTLLRHTPTFNYKKQAVGVCHASRGDLIISNMVAGDICGEAPTVDLRSLVSY
jgi:hypothetical protein